MSIGIPRAIDQRGRRLDRWDIEKSLGEFHRPLRCAECSATVEPVSGYRTRSGTQVVPLFRLAKGGAHDDGCDYDFDRQVGELHSRHVGVIERDGDTYVLVLSTLTEVPPSQDPEAVGDPRSRIHFDSSRSEPLNRTLRAAAEIARLIRKFDHDAEAMERFRARYAGQTITWRDFCFDASADLRRLHQALVSAEPGSDHPRAVVGRVEHRRTAVGQTPSVFLAVRSPDSDYARPVRTAEGIPIAPVLRSRDSKRLAGEVDDVVVGYGKWINFPARTGSRHYVTLWLDGVRGAMCLMRP